MKLSVKEKNLIRESILFRGMTEEELAHALEALRARRKNCVKDEFLLLAGNLTNDLGMVLAGSVTIESNDIWGNRTIIGHAGEGDYYGEVFAILKDERSYVDVRVNEKAVVMLFDMSCLQQISTDSHSWNIKLISNILAISLQKNIVLAKRSFHTAPKSARGRIMAYLNSMAMSAGKPEFNIPFDRQRMADYLNLDRTALSKELGKMRDDGLIFFHKNHFQLIR